MKNLKVNDLISRNVHNGDNIVRVIYLVTYLREYKFKPTYVEGLSVNGEVQLDHTQLKYCSKLNVADLTDIEVRILLTLILKKL